MELCRGDGGGGALRGLICGAMPDHGLAGVSMRGGSDGYHEMADGGVRLPGECGDVGFFGEDGFGVGVVGRLRGEGGGDGQAGPDGEGV